MTERQMNPPIPGHELIDEGMIYPGWDPQPPHGLLFHSGGCRCGAKPPGFPNVSKNKMKAWHRLHKEAIRSADRDIDAYQDHHDPQYVVGAVLAQLEDLTRELQRTVLVECLAHVESELARTGCYACGSKTLAVNRITLTCAACRAVQPERVVVREWLAGDTRDH